MKAVGLCRAVEKNAMLLHTWRIKVIRHTADGKYQIIIVNTTLFQHHFTTFVQYRSQGYLTLRSVQTGKSAELKVKTMSSGMSTVSDLINIYIQRACGYFV